MTQVPLMRSLKSITLCTTAIATLGFAAHASAQDAPAAEEVVVTGSRIIKDGFAQPTPVTVVSMEQMQQTAPNSLSDAINQLPQFKASFVSASTGFRNGAGSGGNFVNLRGLSPKRTLVLLDGKRVVQSQANSSVAGAVDLNTLPQNLVKRVDVVTGGASAAYGADALSGVVNFVLDSKFNGIKGEVRYGQSQQGDNQTYDASVAIGHSFLDGRAHVLASVEYYRTLGIKDFTERSWADNSTGALTTTNPLPQTSTSTPTRIVTSNIRPSNLTSGGLITGGATALRDLYFVGVGPAAAAVPYPIGTFRTATTMVGGGVEQDYGRYYSSLPPNQRNNVFLRGSYDLNSNWTVYGEGLWGYSKSNYRGTLASTATTGAFTLFSDNPYLPASVRTAMSGPGATSVALYNPATGTFTGPSVNTITVGRLDLDLGFKREYSDFSTLRGVFGIDGKFNAVGTDWTVNAYYTHGEALHKTASSRNPIMANLFRAVDVVSSPGGAGLPTAGTPICRSTTYQPGNGCVPLNIVGTSAASAAAVDYILGGTVNGTTYLRQTLKQDVADASIHGEPFSTWAGPVSVGAGASYRKESVVGVADPISESYLGSTPGTTTYKPGLTPVLDYNLPAALRGTRQGFEAGNQGGFAGQYNVKEVFGETLIPLLRDGPFGKSFDLNGAIRYADYSTSGGVLNWKVGLTYRPIEDLRIRTTRSRDVRAANLADLYGGVTQNNPAVSDPFRRGTTGSAENNPNAVTAAQGNPNLQPEIGDTFTLGAVYSPSFTPWLQGLSLSVDYYSIIITNAIASPGAATILNQCLQGNTAFCGLVTRNLDPASFGAGNTIGPITRLENSPQNIGTTKNSGVDFEASYRLPLSRFAEGRDDTLNFRLLASYLGKNSTVVVGGASVTNSIGVVGGGIVGGTGGNADWTGSLNVNYQRGPLTINWQERFINKGRINANVDELGAPYPSNLLINPNTTGSGQVPNTIPAYFYADLSATYKFGKNQQFEGFLTINNLFDKDPPSALGSYFFYGVIPTNYTLYDTIGRNYTAGVRFKF